MKAHNTPVVVLALAKVAIGYQNTEIDFAYQQVQQLMASVRRGDHELSGGTSVGSILDAMNQRESKTNAFINDLTTAEQAAAAAGVDEDFFNSLRWNHGRHGFLIGLAFATLALQETGAR